MTEVKDIKKVNLGCGSTIAPGWINIDVSQNIMLSKLPLLKWILYKIGLLSEAAYKEKWPAGIIRHDVRRGLPFKDCSVLHIYTSHLLEHLTRHEANKLLRECYRILKPQGWIRIVVPDFELLVDRYKRNELSIEGFLHCLGMRESENDAFLSFLYSKDRHKWMYDFQSQTHLLKVCGFKIIVRRKFREGKVPDLYILDNREKESLYVEAQKI